jgi:hypothetical protein
MRSASAKFLDFLAATRASTCALIVGVIQSARDSPRLARNICGSRCSKPSTPPNDFKLLKQLQLTELRFTSLARSNKHSHGFRRVEIVIHRGFEALSVRFIPINNAPHPLAPPPMGEGRLASLLPPGIRGDLAAVFCSLVEWLVVSSRGTEGEGRTFQRRIKPRQRPFASSKCASE